ncbi:FKBP-type peptidyl-prolyl cis-trans isomerase [Ensifer sp. LCM 4579]|nr:FKBP-type peptidyl-prolyl cis-trans isomerase [Ensifer sp. LCM 4579]
MTDVRNGDLVHIHYTAKLTDGTAIDSTLDREPLEFQVGAGQVISGLDR